MLSRDAFVDTVAAKMSLSADDLSTSTFEEMGLDSIQLYELDVVVESLGVLLAEHVLTSMRRIDDIYQEYAIDQSAKHVASTE